MHGTKLPVLEAAMLYRFVSLPHPVQLWAYISRSLATKGWRGWCGGGLMFGKIAGGKSGGQRQWRNEGTSRSQRCVQLHVRRPGVNLEIKLLGWRPQLHFNVLNAGGEGNKGVVSKRMFPDHLHT